MKILQLIHKIQNRGAETFACQLSNHLIDLGHEVKVVALYAGEAKLPFNGNIEIVNANSTNTLLNIRTCKRLSHIINNFQPEILQANSGDTLKYAVFSKLLFNWKNPIISRNASEVGRYLKSSFQKKFNGYLYNKVAGITSVSIASEKDLLIHFPTLLGKTQVIPVGIEIEDTIQSKALEPLSHMHIVHVGGFSFEKNHFGLIRIFQLILMENSYVHLHLIGDGLLRKEIENRIKEFKLEDKVTFYGFVTNPLPYIGAADALVLPSIIEGLPGVILEAMYCKTPVIAYDVGGISEVLNSKTGKIISKGQEKIFANEVLNSLKCTNDQQVNNAYKMVHDHFLNKNLALKFVNFYKNININHSI